MQAVSSQQHNADAAAILSEPLLKEVDAAKLINVAPRTLETWRAKGIGPRFIRLNGNRAVRYRPADVRNWMDFNETGGAAA